MTFPRRELMLYRWLKIKGSLTTGSAAEATANTGQRADASRAINCAIAPDRPALRASVQDVVQSACFPA